MPELRAQALLLLEAPRLLPNLRLFRRNVGASKAIYNGVERFVRFGIKGQCDIWGTFKGGQHIELELKARNGRLSEEQEAWRDFCRSWDVPWLLLQEKRSETPEQCVVRWCGGDTVSVSPALGPACRGCIRSRPSRGWRPRCRLPSIRERGDRLLAERRYCHVHRSSDRRIRLGGGYGSVGLW
jgi:hypothetical protein